MKRALLIVGLTSSFLTACGSQAMRVAVKQTTTSRFRFEVIEHTKDPFRHRPAIRIYRFTTPVAPVIAASEIRNYSTYYTGEDGTAYEWGSLVAGYIVFPNLNTLQKVEFRLIAPGDGADHPRYALPINGVHSITAHQ
jgi:hypothetical protein